MEFGLDRFEVGYPGEEAVKRDAEVFQGGGLVDGTVVDGKMKITVTEGAGGAAYNNRLGLGGIDRKEPLVTPSGEEVQMLLEKALGALKGRR